MNSADTGLPSVYFARAVDDLPLDAVKRGAVTVEHDLLSFGLRIVDAVVLSRGARGEPMVVDLVEFDLALLRQADGLLVDMTIPNRNYIGCCCELVYAKQWGIPSSVYIGNTGLDRRIWLRHHATVITIERAESIERLARAIHLEGARRER
jgi:hypothetical protein